MYLSPAIYGVRQSAAHFGGQLHEHDRVEWRMPPLLYGTPLCLHLLLRELPTGRFMWSQPDLVGGEAFGIVLCTRPMPEPDATSGSDAPLAIL